ncbi:MAG: hypothetical protein AAFX06_23210 [Planctomycetota bacterium]
MVPRHLYIFGGTSTALEIQDAANASAGVETYLVVPSNESPNGRDRIDIGDLVAHTERNPDAGFILSMTEQAVRRECLSKAELAGLEPVSVIHPSAMIAPSAHLLPGAYAAAFAVVSSHASVGPHTMINFHSVVGHHCVVGESVFLHPGARLGGNARIGNRVMVGSNAFVHQGRRVEDDVIIDAMTYVDRDVPAGHICSSRRNDGRPIKRAFFVPEEADGLDAGDQE